RPGVLGRLARTFEFRNQRVARVDLFPVQAAPGASLLRTYSELRVRVSWTEGAANAPPKEAVDPFESLYREQVVNYEAARAMRRPRPADIGNPVQGPRFFTASTGPWIRMHLARRGIYQVT